MTERERDYRDWARAVGMFDQAFCYLTHERQPDPDMRHAAPAISKEAPTYTIIEIPNEWGWYGACDRAAYAVMRDGKEWSRFCYREMAVYVIDRLEREGPHD